MARGLWAVRQAVAWVVGVAVVAWVGSWFGVTFFGVRSFADLGPLAFFGVLVMTPLAWLIYPWEMRFQAWDRRRREQPKR